MKEPYNGRKCGAQKLSGVEGDTCNNPAGYGTEHPGFGRCKRHFGSTPGPARGAFREMVAAMGDPLYVEPAQALVNEIARANGHVYWLSQKIAAFKFPEVIDEDGVGPDPEKFLSPNQMSWYKIYLEERRHLVDVSAIAIKAGMADRALRLAEREGEMMALAIQRILDRLGLTDAQLDMVPDVVPDVLRQLTAEPPAIEGPK